ncbi:MAG: type I pullulanase [Candidatus Izimaplasma sp.]|nr:type I pullulanase [Candidatus Izimaplasma bacterium]
MNRFYSYLDDFSCITIIVPKSYRDDYVSSFKVVGNEEEIELEITKTEDLGTERKYTTKFDGYILLNKMYYVFDDKEGDSELFTGKIVRTQLFDDIYYYEESDLGSSYRRDRTKFKIWTPVAKYIKLELTDKEGKKEVIDMEYDNVGVWYLRLRGDYEGYRYRFISYVNGKEHTLTDPYGISSTANGEYSYVVDTSNFSKMRAQRPKFSGVYTEALIYETHIRDFTIDDSIDVENPGKYKAFATTGLTSKAGHAIGLDHIKDLGVTHVQLMPIYDYETVDELNPNKKYNWGYDPGQYNVPEGSFSTDPDDPYKRINELKDMINEIHKSKLRVVMDVVFNHVYDHETFPFEKIVPGYAYRFDKNGHLADDAGVGNVLASERRMIRKYIIDSVLFWAKEYKIDGFRFDLMGLIDIRTMNTLRQKLDRFKDDIIVYGEGWRMPTEISDEMAAHMYNPHLLFNIGHFNDKMRETIKGATFDIKQRGYALGSNALLDKIKHLIQGSTLDKFLFRYPTQSINYVECHDNNTFYDKAVGALKDASKEEIKARQRLATSMVVLSQGVPFIHSGQEFYRSKNGVENSYKSPDKINKLDWSLLDENYDDITYLKELIRLRKKYDLFRLTRSSKIKKYTTVSMNESGTILYRLKDNENELLVIFKNNTEKETFELDEEYTLIFDGEKRSRRVLNKINVKDISTYIIKKK